MEGHLGCVNKSVEISFLPLFPPLRGKNLVINPFFPILPRFSPLPGEKGPGGFYLPSLDSGHNNEKIGFYSKFLRPFLCIVENSDTYMFLVGSTRRPRFTSLAIKIFDLSLYNFQLLVHFLDYNSIF